MCAPNDMNTYPIGDLQASFSGAGGGGGLSTYFVNIQDLKEKNTGFNYEN